MENNYRVSNDGTIFGIKDDGSIEKIAKIDGRGRITTLSGVLMSADEKTEVSNNNKAGYWFFIIVFAFMAIIFGALYSEAKDDCSQAWRELNDYKNQYENTSSTVSSLRNEVAALRNENNNLKRERDNAKSELTNLKSKVSNTYPFIINDIEIANVYYDGDVHTNYGNSIYSSYTMYLRPRIKYMGLDVGSKTIKVKWYRPDGTISRGDTSPYGFSQSQTIYLQSGNNNLCELSGWGSSTMGHWGRGTYRIEIWYENTCLKAKTFTIY